ncbi:acyl carrier protein [Petrotoga sp. DB-2]
MERKLIELVKKILNIESIEIDTNKDQISEWDSLANLQIIAEVEEKFNVKIPFEKISEIKNIRDILNIIKSE